MLRILRAFAWLRWRVLVNSLERTGARDTVERFSLAIEQLGPLIALALLIPSALGLAALSAFAGYEAARSGSAPLAFSILRYILLAASGFCIIGPTLLPGNEQMNAVRLLLLPIPRRILYLAQTAGTVSEPWILLLLPIVAALPLGMAAGGAGTAALIALVAGLLLVIAFIGLSSATSAIVQLVVRDRRRGELVALFFILILPLLGVLPGLLDAQSRRAERRGEVRPTGAVLPDWVRDTGARLYSMAPSELFTRATRDALERNPVRSTPSLFALAVTGAVLHGIGLVVFARLLDSPASTGPRRVGARSSAWSIRLPGLSPGASAVALAQLRLALRTPRGRSSLMSPLLMFLVFTVVMRSYGGGMEFGFITLVSGPGLATFGSVVSLLAILPFAMNQFAIDRAGLTLAFLSPLRDVELLTGKAVGNGLIAAGPALLCIVIAFVMFPTGDLSLWASLPLGLCATYLLLAPAAAALSAVFPRAVDLNSSGRGSNAHGAAGLLGTLAFVAAGAPTVVITLLITQWLNRPSWLPVMLILWCVASLVLSRLMFLPVGALFARRRENLALVG